MITRRSFLMQSIGAFGMTIPQLRAPSPQRFGFRPKIIRMRPHLCSGLSILRSILIVII